MRLFAGVNVTPQLLILACSFDGGIDALAALDRVQQPLAILGGNRRVHLFARLDAFAIGDGAIVQPLEVVRIVCHYASGHDHWWPQLHPSHRVWH